MPRARALAINDVMMLHQSNQKLTTDQQDIAAEHDFMLLLIGHQVIRFQNWLVLGKRSLQGGTTVVVCSFVNEELVETTECCLKPVYTSRIL